MYTFDESAKEIQDILAENPAGAAECVGRVDALRLTKQDAGRLEALILQLPPEIARENCDVCFGMILLQLQKGNEAAAGDWYKALCAQREGPKYAGGQRSALDNRIFCANITMRSKKHDNILFRLAVLAHEFSESKQPLVRLSATGKKPSVLRGSQDFSVLGKHYKASASMMRGLLPYVLYDEGKGVCETAMAEVLYERGDLNAAAMQAAVAINTQDPETAFAALALMAHVAAADKGGQPHGEVLQRIGAMLEETDARWLLPNHRALCVRFDMLCGDLDRVRGWLEECGLNELDKIAPAESYEMITKARAHVALGELRTAAALLESLIVHARLYERILDEVECLVLSAIVCERLGSGELALQKLEQALLLAGEYLYVRVFADCGQPAFQLLKKYGKLENRSGEIGEKYLRRAIDAAGGFSIQYPALFKAENGNGGEKKAAPGAEGTELTTSELHVLQLMVDGKSNKAIAQELTVAPSTVKFHVSNILQKMEADNRVKAIQTARERGILV